MPCPRANTEEVCAEIEENATAETSPLIDKKVAELAALLTPEQNRLLNEIEDLYARQTGALISTALNYRGCAKG